MTNSNMRIATFGDSWPFGDELALGELTYGALLASRFNVPFDNCAKNATSNEHMILQLEKYIRDNQSIQGTVAVFFITTPARMTMIDHDGSLISIYPWADGSRGDHAHAWYKYFHSTHQDRLRTVMSILSLQKICQHEKIRDYYIVGWSQIDLDFPGINQEKIYHKTCAELFGAPAEHEFTMAGENPFVKPNICHPNQSGHQLIAKNLYEWINHD